MKISRRQFIAGGLASSALLVGAASAADTTVDVEYTYHKLALPGRALGLAGIKIAFLTDIHFGSAFPPLLLDQIVAKVNEEDVDLVFLGGDNSFIPSSPAAYIFERVRSPKYAYGSDYARATLIYKDMAEILAQLKSRYGVFSVHGNHDHWTEPRQLARAFGDARIHHGTNAVHEIVINNSLLRIILLDDYITGIPQPPKLSDTLDAAEYRVLLTHNSDIYRKLLATNALKFDLGLTGHTHGGQIQVPWLGALSYRIRDLRFWKGWITIGDTSFFTSRGIGVVEIPYRINCRPEVAFIKLVKPAEGSSTTI